jgi:hypothetical protein
MKKSTESDRRRFLDAVGKISAGAVLGVGVAAIASGQDKKGKTEKKIAEKP